MSGWIKVHRTLFDHWIAKDKDHLVVWLRMLSEANFEGKTKLFNGSLVTVNRGQIIFGLQAWSDKTGVQISKLRRLISLLQSDSMIDRQTFNKFSLISIVNYELYQSDDRQDDSQTAGNPQANDRQPATPKEGKKERSKNVLSNNANIDFSIWNQKPSEQVLAAWLAMRKKVKASCSQNAMNTIGNEINKAIESGFTVDECLNHAEVSSWKGFRAEWMQNVRGQQNVRQAGYTPAASKHQQLADWSSAISARCDEQLAAIQREKDIFGQNGGGSDVSYVPDVDERLY